MNSSRLFLLLVSLALLWSLAGCAGSSRAPIVPIGPTRVAELDELTLEAVRQTKPGPPIVARMLGMVHTAIYDAWAAYDTKAVGTRLHGDLRRPVAEHTKANKEKAISYAAYRVLVDLFPTKKQLFDDAMWSYGYDPNDESLDITTPQGIGNRAAQALLEYRHRDGSNQLGDLHPGAYSDYTGYEPVNTVDEIIDPNRWQPLRFSDGQGGFRVPGFIAPHWGNVKAFAVADAASLRPQAPPLAGTDEFRRQTQEIVDLTANLTDREKVIAEYWADGPGTVLPPGHWCLFAQWVSARDRNTLDQDVKLFFMVANAVMDAGICCWETKRYYDYCRPITAIRWLFEGQMIPGWGGPGQGTVLMDGRDWKPYQPDTFITPPFAEYTSGHSTFSAASAEILKRFTGSDRFGHSVTYGAGQTLTEPGITPAQPVTLAWPTFSAAADEAGISRRVGGIHFEWGDLFARRMGREIGALVWDKAHTYFDGTAPRPTD